MRMAVLTRFLFVCALGGHLGSGKISEGEIYPGSLAFRGISNAAGEAHACDDTGPSSPDGRALPSVRGSSAEGGSSAGGGLSEADGPGMGAG